MAGLARSRQRVREELLLTMYRSVTRMDEHLLVGRADGAGVEMHLQINLRRNFEGLYEREIRDSSRL